MPFLECDLGQGEFTPPGLVALHDVTSGAVRPNLNGCPSEEFKSNCADRDRCATGEAENEVVPTEA